MPLTPYDPPSLNTTGVFVYVASIAVPVNVITFDATAVALLLVNSVVHANGYCCG